MILCVVSAVVVGSACSKSSAPKAAQGRRVENAFTQPPSGAGECDVTPMGGSDEVPSGTKIGVPPTLAPGTDIGGTGSGPGSGNPYTALGARPVPGPDLPNTTLGAQPSTRVVMIPPNPDMGSPAARPAGATTVPRPPTTLPAPVTTDASSGSNAPPSTDGMKSAADPGCVASPDDP